VIIAKRHLTSPRDFDDFLLALNREGHYLSPGSEVPRGYPCVCTAVEFPSPPFTAAVYLTYPNDFSSKFNSLYEERNRIVALVVFLARRQGYKTGCKKDPEDPEYPIVFIDLPCGQVSWRVHGSDLRYFPSLGPYPKEWDKHTSREKYDRILRMVRGLL
jgi:hypothetical protein